MNGTLERPVDSDSDSPAPAAATDGDAALAQPNASPLARFNHEWQKVEKRLARNRTTPFR